MKIHTVAEVKSKEKALIELGFSEQDMIAQVGSLASEEILNWANTFEPGQIKRFVILCGAGNNGADGFAIAQALHESEANIIVCTGTTRQKLSKNAAFFAEKMDQHIEVYPNGKKLSTILTEGDCIIDCMIGTGCSAPLRQPYNQWCEYINTQNLPVVSIDVPTGLNADTGDCYGSVLQANLTLICGWVKKGILFKQGPEVCGRLKILPVEKLQKESDNFYSIVEACNVLSKANKLKTHTYKYQQGQLSIIAGSETYAGAASLCSESALRMGCGLVQLITSNTCTFSKMPNAIIQRRVSSDPHGFINENEATVSSFMVSSNFLLIGPGLGVTTDTQTLFDALLINSNVPKHWVIDASAITLFAQSKVDPKQYADKTLIFTPHMGEAKCLAEKYGIPFPVDIHDTQTRIELATELAKSLKAIVVLKGARTICADINGRWCINGSGSPALATAGSGDVLAGMIAGHGCATPHQTAYDIALFSVFVHGYLVENTTLSMRGLIADDLVDLIPQVLKTISPFA